MFLYFFFFYRWGKGIILLRPFLYTHVIVVPGFLPFVLFFFFSSWLELRLAFSSYCLTKILPFINIISTSTSVSFLYVTRYFASICCELSFSDYGLSTSFFLSFSYLDSFMSWSCVAGFAIVCNFGSSCLHAEPFFFFFFRWHFHPFSLSFLW